MDIFEMFLGNLYIFPRILYIYIYIIYKVKCKKLCCNYVYSSLLSVRRDSRTGERGCWMGLVSCVWGCAKLPALRRAESLLWVSYSSWGFFVACCSCFWFHSPYPSSLPASISPLQTPSLHYHPYTTHRYSRLLSCKNSDTHHNRCLHSLVCPHRFQGDSWGTKLSMKDYIVFKTRARPAEWPANIYESSDKLSLNTCLNTQWQSPF